MEQFFSIPAQLQPINEWVQTGWIAPKNVTKRTKNGTTEAGAWAQSGQLELCQLNLLKILTSLRNNFGVQIVSERNELANLARYAAKMFKLMSSLRGRHGIDFDEVLIFFALGRLNFDHIPGNLMFVKPANIVSLSDFMEIPRETLRRKLLRLEEKELVQRTSYGFVVKDLASWKRLAELSQLVEADA